MSLIDKILGRTPPEEPNVEVGEVQEEDTFEHIEERALNLLIDALDAEKEKIMSDAFLYSNKEKISYADMVLALEKNGFSVELLNTD